MLSRGSRITGLLLAGTAAVSMTIGATLSAGAQAPGESTLDKILSSGVLRFGVPVAGLPVAAKDESGNIVGVIPDMAAEMAKALSGPDTPDAVKLEIVDTPGPDRIPFIQAGKIDVSVGTVTLQRALAVGFTDIWAVDGTAAAVLKSSGITDYSNISGKNVAVVTGATGDLVATAKFPDNNFQRVDLASTALQAVVSGQADIVFDDYSFLALAAQQNPDLVLLPAVTTEPSGLMAPIGDQTWINWLNFFLHDYYSSGVSTCGCGIEKYKEWFKVDPLPLTWSY
ncbi:MAG: transporter substrate-binding domain-containing protein [Chloroflexota bacterium]